MASSEREGDKNRQDDWADRSLCPAVLPGQRYVRTLRWWVATHQRKVRGTRTTGLLSARPLEAGAAVDGLVVARHEGHQRLAAALRADGGVHLTRGTLLPARGHPLAPLLAALGAAAGLVAEALLLIDLLLSRADQDVLAAFSTAQ